MQRECTDQLIFVSFGNLLLKCTHIAKGLVNPIHKNTKYLFYPLRCLLVHCYLVELINEQIYFLHF